MKWIKKLFGFGRGKTDAASTPFRWLAADENPWGVPVLDMSVYTSTVIACSTKKQDAINAVSYFGETGKSFVGLAPRWNRQVATSLEFRTDGHLHDGMLFCPSEMEDKWAIYFYDNRFIFVRGWAREVFAVANAIQEDRKIVITSVTGGVDDGSYDDKFIEDYFDFLIRSHCLGDAIPCWAPKCKNDQEIVNWCFQQFGRKVKLATVELFARDVPAQILRSNSILHMAAAAGDVEAMRRALSKGISANALSTDGHLPIEWALVNNEFQDAADLLLSEGADIDGRTEEGATALMAFAQNNGVEQCRYLLSNGADVNAKDDRGFTPLHRSAERGYLELTQLFLEHGADVEADAEGHTPISLAESRSEQDILNLLRRLG